MDKALAEIRVVHVGEGVAEGLSAAGAGLAGLARPGAQPLYAYPQAHLAFWRTVRAQAGVAAWDAAVPPGLFGEDLLLAGVREPDLWIGDRLRGPAVQLAVNAPRLPDAHWQASLARSLGFAQAGKLLGESGFCGFYLAVVEPGPVAVGERWVLEPGPREVNLRELFRSRLGR